LGIKILDILWYMYNLIIDNRSIPQDEKEEQMSRLDALASGTAKDDKKQTATCSLTNDEADRVKAVMEKFGISRRSELMHNCLMDGVDKLEAAPAPSVPEPSKTEAKPAKKK
jgi:hypothetical protein